MYLMASDQLAYNYGDYRETRQTTRIFGDFARGIRTCGGVNSGVIPDVR